MTGTDPEETLRQLAAESLAADDPTGWFERAYAAGEDGTAVVPWDLRTPNRLLVEWAERRDLKGAARSALVVGCGMGRDAEYVARLGFDTVAFDVAETAVRVARRRYPDGPVEGPPWPLTRAEIESFGVGHLQPVLIEDIRDVPEPGDRRWRAEFRRPRP